MNGFDKRRFEKEQAILKSAEELFFKNGFKTTAVVDIAKQADVSQVTIYNYFDTKEKLAHRVFLRYLEESFSILKLLLEDKEKDFETKVKDMMYLEGSFSQKVHPDFYAFMLADINSANQEALAIYNQQKKEFFNQLFKQGRKEGKISAEVSNQAVMVYLDMMMQYMQKNQSDNQQLLSMAEELTHLFFYGLIGKV